MQRRGDLNADDHSRFNNRGLKQRPTGWFVGRKRERCCKSYTTHLEFLLIFLP